MNYKMLNLAKLKYSYCNFQLITFFRIGIKIKEILLNSFLILPDPKFELSFI